MKQMGHLQYDGQLLKCFSDQVGTFEPNMVAGIEGAYAYGEQFLTAGMCEYFSNEATFLDIGANIGCFTVMAAKRCKAVYAFEPNPDYFALLQQNVAKFDNVKMFNSGVMDADGVLQLSLDENQKEINMVYPHRLIGHEGAITVPAKTLDSYKINADIIKIDVGGAEILVIEGGLETLKGAEIIFVEHYGMNLGHFLTELGFKNMSRCGDKHYSIKNDLQIDEAAMRSKSMGIIRHTKNLEKLNMSAYQYYIDRASYHYNGEDHRRHTILEAMTYLPPAPRIVEIGTVRRDDLIHGEYKLVEGGSTLCHAIGCAETEGHLWAIDISNEAIEMAKNVTKEYAEYITYKNMDGIEFLKTFEGDMDLLYLDAWHPILHDGFDKPLEAFLAIKGSVSFVQVDDIMGRNNLWKGERIIPYLLTHGYEEVFFKNEQGLYRKR